ncbi:hypothetical protein C0989_002398, partial [Termitomyces sp. Mn162]
KALQSIETPPATPKKQLTIMCNNPPVKAEPVHDAESNGMLVSLGSPLVISSDSDNDLPIVF